MFIFRLGASIGELMDLIFAARLAKNYEKSVEVPKDGEEEIKKDCDDEALFGIMEKTLRLLDIGFSELEISAAFEKHGSEASLQELTDLIIRAQLGESLSNSEEFSSTSMSNLPTQINVGTLKGEVPRYSSHQPLVPLTVKIEECRPDGIAPVEISDLLKKLKGKRPQEEYTDEPKSLKKPKEEFNEDSRNPICQMWQEARSGNSTSAGIQVPASQKQFGSEGSIEEDRKPLLRIPNPSKSLTSVVEKPPYFFYGSVTNLSQESWVKISQFLYSVQPEYVNTGMHSALQRKEGYVHNLPTENRFHIFQKAPMTIKDAIPHTRKWWPSWDTREQLSNISCETTGISIVCDKLGRMLRDSKGILTMVQQRNFLQRCQVLNLVWLGHHKLAPLEPEHLECIMGYPSHHSRATGCGLSERLESLKLAFQTDTLAYFLSVLSSMFPEGITVLSFFSGIGGDLVALHRLGIRLKGVVSVESCETNRRIVKQWWVNTGQTGELIQLENSHKLASHRLEDLIKKFGGFHLVMCQNSNSAADSGQADLNFSLFVEFVRVLQRVRTAMRREK